ncbi:hypothetical protein [Vibrio aquimaris]|uniref:Secreted protein n=1 Tax=Vibrio aquimaris TaxID=2587862 RepID=A0A5P9CHZ3_9VIBR|nr:hypothetical protein [Vibrio aquimaris]QFT25493.1 hypothetical protein FIV01_03425 [Vibrio aquimaris]
MKKILLVLTLCLSAMVSASESAYPCPEGEVLRCPATGSGCFCMAE